MKPHQTQKANSMLTLGHWHVQVASVKLASGPLAAPSGPPGMSQPDMETAVFAPVTLPTQTNWINPQFLSGEGASVSPKKPSWLCGISFRPSSEHRQTQSPNPEVRRSLALRCLCWRRSRLTRPDVASGRGLGGLLSGWWGWEATRRHCGSSADGRAPHAPACPDFAATPSSPTERERAAGCGAGAGATERSAATHLSTRCELELEP
jgi:hypothetical protein